MTESPSDALLDAFDDSDGGVVLPTFRVLARFRSTASDERAAVAEVTDRLDPVRGMYDEVYLERTEDDGTLLVLASFVTVAVEAHEAVVAVHDTLREAGVALDEAWVDTRGRS